MSFAPLVGRKMPAKLLAVLSDKIGVSINAGSISIQGKTPENSFLHLELLTQGSEQTILSVGAPLCGSEARPYIGKHCVSRLSHNQAQQLSQWIAGVASQFKDQADFELWLDRIENA